MRSPSSTEQHASGLQLRPKTAVASSQAAGPSTNIMQRTSEEGLGRRIESEEMAVVVDLVDDEKETDITTDDGRRRKRSASSKAGLNEFTNGVKTIVRRASVSMRSALPRRARKGGRCQNCGTVNCAPGRADGDEDALAEEEFVPIQEASTSSSCGEKSLHTGSPHRVIRMFSFHRDRRNAISGPGTGSLQYRSQSFSTVLPGSGLGPPVFSRDMSFGAAARAAAAAAAAQTERSHYSRFKSGKHEALGSVISLTRDSESGVFLDSQDESDMESAVVLIRRDPVAKLPSEITSMILAHLDIKSLCRAQRVSKAWLEAASVRHLWRDAFHSKYRHHEDTFRSPIPMGGLGIGKDSPDQEWKEMYRVRHTIDRNWSTGNARSIYFKGHTDSVYCVQFDEEKIITGSRDRTIRVWDIDTYRCLKVIGGPDYQPEFSESQDSMPVHDSVVPSPACLNGSEEGYNIYHVPSDYHDASILCLQFDHEHMITGSSDNDCLVWDMTNYEPLWRLRHHTMGVLDVCFDQNHVVTCSKDHTICVWGRSNGWLLRVLQGHRGPVNAVQLRGDLLVSASGDGVAKLWNLRSGLCVKEFVSQDRGLAAVEFSFDAMHVLAGGNDNVVYKFSVATGELEHTYEGHSGLVRSLFLDAPNNRVVSGSYDQSIRVYAFREGRLVAQYPNWTTSWILAAKCDYRRIVATSQDGRAIMLDFGYDVKGKDLLRGPGRVVNEVPPWNVFHLGPRHDSGHDLTV